MAFYDYVKGKERVIGILDNEVEVENKQELPNINQLTFSNGCLCWVTGVFVDIRESTKLFSNTNKTSVAKVVRSFSSEIIEILNDSNDIEEIGIRGDCVYAIYSTAQKIGLHDIVDKCVWVNTYINMLNKLLVQRNLPEVKVGIGISTSRELVVKAGRKDSGVNSRVWIGSAVTYASKFSGMGGKNGLAPIVMAETTYENSIDLLKKENGCLDTWFKQFQDDEYGIFYAADIVKSDFADWIDNGMNS